MNTKLENDIKKAFTEKTRDEVIVYILYKGKNTYGRNFFEVITDKNLYEGIFYYDERPLPLRFLGSIKKLELNKKISFQPGLYKWKSVQDRILIIQTKERIYFRFFYEPEYDPVEMYYEDSGISMDMDRKFYHHIEVPNTKISRWWDILLKGLNEKKLQLTRENQLALENEKNKSSKAKLIKAYEMV